uniref:CCHC-type domain-containing protein n=1 Tax=Caenorhabditis japonica TaxID=281687 RepID=A0A8R1DMB9_CAEJA
MDSNAMKLFLAQQKEAQQAQQKEAQQAQEQQFNFFKEQQEQLLRTMLAALTTQKDPTGIINSLNNRIPTFTYAPEDGETFDKWFGRHENTIKLDGADLDDSAKARFILTKLDKKEAEQFRNHVLPKTPAEVNFEDTIQMLKKLFNETKSLTRLRYELLSVKFNGYDRKQYTGLVKSRFSAAQWTKMTEDQAQCLLWIIGLQSNEHLDLRLRALRELELNPSITLSELADRLDQVIALRNDADFIGGPPTAVHAVNKHAKRQQRYDKGRRHESTKAPTATVPSQSTSSSTPSTPSSSTTSSSHPCSKCCRIHGRQKCRVSKYTVCRNCNKAGHLARACRQKKTHVSNAIFIAHTSAAKHNRIYTTVHINGKPIKMQLDTGAEATLLNVKDWERLNKPKLSPSSANLRTTTNAQIKVRGQLNCKFVLNGHHGSGRCLVTDTVSLLGMDWIAQDNHLYQLLQGRGRYSKARAVAHTEPKDRHPAHAAIQKVPRSIGQGLPQTTRTPSSTPSSSWRNKTINNCSGRCYDESRRKNKYNIPLDSRIPEERLRKMEETEREAIEVKKEIHEEADMTAGSSKLSKGKSMDSLNMQVDYRPWYDSEKIKSAVSRESIANIATSREFFETASTRDWRSGANSRRDSMCSVNIAPLLPPKSDATHLRQAVVNQSNGRSNGYGHHYSSAEPQNVNVLTISSGYDGNHQNTQKPLHLSHQPPQHPPTSINRLLQQDSPQTVDPIEQQEVLLMLYLKQNMDIVQDLGIHIPNDLLAEMDDLQMLPVELRICDEEPHRMFSPVMKNGRYQRKPQVSNMPPNRQMMAQKYVGRKEIPRSRQNSEMSDMSSYQHSSYGGYH